MSDLLQLVGVTHRYGNLVAVDELSLTVRPGVIAGLIGPNGSGKSTTLRLCAGLLPLQHGSITVAGHEVARDPIAARRRFSYVPDVPTGFDQLSVREYVDLYGALQRLDDGYRERAQIQLEAIGLAASLDRTLGALSTGNRRKVAIVAGCAALRDLLLVDEATSALDPEAVLTLESLLRFGATHGHAALVATQDLSFAQRNCDLVYLLAAGVIVAHGSPESLRSAWDAADLREVFLKATGFSENLAHLHDALAATLSS